MTDFLTGKEDSRIHLTARINFARDSWNLYASGYLETADSIVDGLLNGSISYRKIDLLIYPSVFLYRHHFELRIKQLYFKVCKFWGSQPNLRRTHTLLEIWEDFKEKILEAAEKFEMSEQTQEYMGIVESKLQQFAELDPSSMAFRYPIEKGNESLKERKYLHLGQLADFARDLAEDLEIIDLELSRWLSIQSDWFSVLEEFGFDWE